MRSLYSLLTLMLVLTVGLRLEAQNNSNFTEFTIEDGLVMSQIESIVQDDEGNLWVGTIGGLSQYDGQEFTNFTQKQGLAEDWISRCYFSKQSNTLWLGHRGGGISIKKTGEDRFTDLKIESHTKYSTVTAFAEDKNGNIWIGVNKVGVLKFDVKSNEVTAIKGSQSEIITSLVADKNNVLWVGSANGVMLVNIENGSVMHRLDQSNELNDNMVNNLCLAMEDEVWIATTYDGIVRVKIPSTTADYKKTLSKKYLNQEDGLTSNFVTEIYEDQKHNVWIGTKQSGIMQFSPLKDKSKENGFAKGDINVFSNKFEMRYYLANDFFEDREGNLWMGTEFGLLKYMGELFKIYDQHDDLINNLVWSILEDNDGNMWFGTSEGVSKFTFPILKGHKQYHNPTVKSYTTRNGLPENIVTAMYQDSKGKIWMGTESNGVFTINQGGVVTRKWNVANGLSDNKIFSINEDKDGNIWLGTGSGVSVIDANGAVKKYNAKDGLGGDKVYAVFTDSKGRVWLGILGGNLTVFESGKFKTFGAEEGVPQKFIIGVTEDNNKNLWFAAYSEGVLKYDGTSFKKYSLEDGLYSNSLHFITCDNENNIWVGQNVGVEKFDASSGKFVLYGKQQGFVGMETNENAVYKDRAGNIWFGTIRGVVKFNPEKDVINLKEPVTNIKSMSIYMHDIPMEDGVSYDYDQNYITFYNKGVCLTNPKEVYYKYKLEGFDDEWTVAMKRSSITYSNLAPGKYTFSVMASNNNGVWNKEPATYSFKITPPFWKTWWFYTLCVIVVVSAVVTYIKAREKRLRETQAKLEHLVEVRTEELQKEKEIVEKQNHNIKESINYARRIQEAILPPDNVVQKLLTESFILYKPKDVVSGDFYWMHKQGTKTYVAAVDCTGHGVPGAFMSLIGYNILEKVINENQKLSPSDILGKLSVEIATVLRQDDENATVKDGMDLALCSIDESNMELEFAGAYNPLYLVRKKELTELKGNKVPIGKGSAKKGVDFDNQKASLEKGDVIYLFSDGFPDQKGGPKRKKYYYPPFRDYLISISELPLEEQKNKLEQELENWRGDVEQFDDVLVLGIKV